MSVYDYFNRSEKTERIIEALEKLKISDKTLAQLLMPIDYLIEERKQKGPETIRKTVQEAAKSITWHKFSIIHTKEDLVVQVNPINYFLEKKIKQIFDEIIPTSTYSNLAAPIETSDPQRILQEISGIPNSSLFIGKFITIDLMAKTFVGYSFVTPNKEKKFIKIQNKIHIGAFQVAPENKIKPSILVVGGELDEEQCLEVFYSYKKYAEKILVIITPSSYKQRMKMMNKQIKTNMRDVSGTISDLKETLDESLDLIEKGKSEIAKRHLHRLLNNYPSLIQLKVLILDIFWRMGAFNDCLNILQKLNGINLNDQSLFFLNQFYTRSHKNPDSTFENLNTTLVIFYLVSRLLGKTEESTIFRSAISLEKLEPKWQKYLETRFAEN